MILKDDTNSKKAINALEKAIHNSLHAKIEWSSEKAIKKAACIHYLFRIGSVHNDEEYDRDTSQSRATPCEWWFLDNNNNK